MIASRLRGWFALPTDSAGLDEMRRDTISEIAAVVFAIAWVIMVASYGNPTRLLVAFALLGSSLGTFWLQRVNWKIAVAWLIASLVAAIALQKWLFPDSPAQHFLPVVVVVSSLLVSSAGVFFVAAVAGATLITVARLQGVDWQDSQQTLVPILMTLLTAAAAWIGSRQIRLALGWTQRNYERVNDLLEELRDERASLARTLRVLEDAYVRIEKMNYALIEARSAAEDARQLKAEFAANISHELRTPLNLIIGFSETMANAPETYQGVAWSPTLRGDIEQIYQSSRHLSSLIDDILDLSALDARRLGLTLQDAMIGDVIAEAVAVMRDLFRAKGLYLNVGVEPGLPPGRMDVTRIRQVLINLLSNASRFTRTGGVTISAGMVDGQLRVAVRDTGIGIAPQDVSKVFEVFGQVDGSTSRRHEGTGLGVPLSKRLVESHGGRMWLESQPGEGTTFFFTLPVLAPAVQGSGSFRTACRALAPAYRKAILVFESDPVLLRTVRRHLSGHDVIEVRDGADLSALIEYHQPVALVVNARDEAVWRSWKVPADLPIISVAMLGSWRAAQSLGVHGYLIKPVLREHLLDAITSVGHEVHDILVVDDEPDLVELTARMLQSIGATYRPIKAFGGADAIARLQGDKVDLVLLDMLMPEVDGMAVIWAMKSDPALAGIPIIVASAQNLEAARGEERLSLQLTRASSPSTMETLNYLQVLVEALPLRGLPATAVAPAHSPVPDDPPAS